VEIASTAGKVVNLLDVSLPKSKSQILLRVRIASVDRNRARQLGINPFNLGLGNAVGQVSTGQFSPPQISNSGTSSGQESLSVAGGSATFTQELNLLAFFPGLGTGASIEALETRGVVQLLAEPNLMAADGKEASFLSGGEYPYPVVSGTSGGLPAVSIEFKEYGIRLNFIPTITPRGTIRLQVAPEVSALDYTNEVQISGFTVPGLTTRRVNTEVELADGESLLIGGLLDKSLTDTFEKIPFIGDIPILGKLFQSDSRTRNDTELIVLVTPEIVSPIPAGKPIPVEKLIESMKPEQPLVIESGTGGFGTSSSAINQGGGASSSAGMGAAAAGTGTAP
jgi:pilus assembly protein CpaC